MAHPSIHHIIPRPEGSDDPDNLITLCQPCHDVIEESDLHSAWSIRRLGASLRGVIKVKKLPKPTNAVSWQEWVYGGCRNPNK